MVTVSVQLLAVRLRCAACGDEVRITHGSDIPNGACLSEPMSAWWVTHLAPEMVLVEALVDGEPADWVRR
jgi:hypothetical protein